MKDIKEMMADTAYAFKNIQMVKHYDFKTEVRDKSKGKTCFAFSLNGDYSVTPLQLLIASAAVVGICSMCCIKKHMRCQKKR